jgi:hypothetical protein
VREGGSYQSWKCVGAVFGGAACGRTGFDAVNEKQMVQPLDSVQLMMREGGEGHQNFDACVRGKVGGSRS